MQGRDGAMAAFPNPIVAHAFTWASRWEEGEIRRAIERAAALGFAAIVIPLRDPASVPAERVAAWCEAAAIVPIGVSGGTPAADVSSPDRETAARGRERLALALARTRDMGARQLNGLLYGPLGKAARRATGDDRRRSADALAELAGAARPMGVRLALECVNRYETNLLNTAAQGLDHLALIGEEGVFLHLDSYHMNIEEESPEAAIAAAASAGRLGFVEFGESHRGRLGTGSVDVAAVARAIARAGWRGPVGLEFFSAGVSAAEIGNTLSIWRDLFADGDDVASGGKKLVEDALAAAWTSVMA